MKSAMTKSSSQRTRNRRRRRPNRSNSDTDCSAPMGTAKLKPPGYAQPMIDPHAYYYTFVVRGLGFDWRYCAVNSNGIWIYNHPSQLFETITYEMKALWRRVCVDQVIRFGDNVDYASFKLIKLKLNIEDVTKSMFDSESEYRECMANAAVAILSDHKAKLLGLTRRKAIYKIFANPESTPQDMNLMTTLERLGIECDPAVNLLTLEN